MYILSSMEGIFLLFVVMAAVAVHFFNEGDRYKSTLLMACTFYFTSLSLCVFNPESTYSQVEALNATIFLNHTVSLALMVIFVGSKLKTVNKALVCLFVFNTWATLLSLYVMAVECV